MGRVGEGRVAVPICNALRTSQKFLIAGDDDVDSPLLGA